MLAWDGQMTIGSQEATMWETYAERLMTLVGKQTNLTIFFYTTYPFTATLPTATEPYCNNGPCISFAQNMFKLAVQMNVDAKGPFSFRWGVDNHQVVFEHPFFRTTLVTRCMSCRSLPNVGGTETVLYL